MKKTGTYGHHMLRVRVQGPLYHLTAAGSDDEERLDASVLLQRLQGDDDDDVICVSSDQASLIHSSFV